jgi:acyl-homoserine lactone acylase PvdQ
MPFAARLFSAALVFFTTLALSACGNSSSVGSDMSAHNNPPPLPAGTDKALIAGTITPPGTDLQHATGEVAAYDDLVYNYPTLQESELTTRYFKDGRFYHGPYVREYRPRAGVLIQRTADFGLPIITGTTDEDAFFGAGYITAEDRLPILELLRVLGRAEAFDVAGTAPSWLQDAEMVRMYGYSEDELLQMIDRAVEVAGPDGPLLRRAFTEFIAGVNTYIAQTGATSRGTWTLGDIVSCTNVIRALFGADGGNELTNASVYLGLVADFGEADARRIYDDFRNRYNSDGPLHTLNSFPYMQRDAARLNPAANVLNFAGGDPGLFGLLPTQIASLFTGAKARAKAASGDALAVRSRARRLQQEYAALDERSRIKFELLKFKTPFGVLNLAQNGHMSNALVVGKSRSASGHPIQLAGPQAAYFSPEILVDFEMHSPNIDARGAGFPGLSFVPTLGRSRNYAWSATAGGSDMIDSFVEELCEADGSPATEQSRSYLHDGDCKPMYRRLVRALPVSLPVDAIPGQQLADIYAERTVHGNVVGRGRVDGKPVAVVRARSSFLKEADGAVTLLRLARGEARTAAQFLEIFRPMNLTSNWMYVNESEIAYHHAGLFPIRSKEVDPDFPVWGTGQWDWQGFLDPSQHPHEINPPRDYQVSWNNRPAPDWGASDTRFSWSSLYRAKMLEDKIVAEVEPITPVRLTQLMEEAGLTDFRGSHVLPVVLRVLAATSAPAEREAAVVQILQQWIANKALRRDGDQDHYYDDGAAISVMDAWWGGLVPAIFNPVLGDYSRIPTGLDNAPGPTGSAYQDGWYGFVWTDLSKLLGDPIKSPTSQAYCGATRETAATLTECSLRLWASLTAAIDAVASQQGGDPAQWKVLADTERIRFLPGAAISMHWVNRPTYQQLMSFGD